MWLETYGCMGPTGMCRCTAPGACIQCMRMWSPHALVVEWLSGNVAATLVICGLQDHSHRVSMSGWRGVREVLWCRRFLSFVIQ